MKCAGKCVEDAWGRAETKGEAGVDVVLPSPVHTKEFPLRRLDWNHSEGGFQIDLRHPGSLLNLLRGPLRRQWWSSGWRILLWQ